MTSLLFHGSTLYQSKIKQTIKTNYHLTPTQHAKRATQDDRYGEFVLPTELPKKYEIVELEQQNGRNTKYVIRYEFDEKYDMCLVIRPNSRNKTYSIITTWLNCSEDNHTTLDTSKYDNYQLVQY